MEVQSDHQPLENDLQETFVCCAFETSKNVVAIAEIQFESTKKVPK